MNISLLVAVSDNGVIGKNGKRGFNLRDDMLRFKALSLKHPVIMGRRTFESLRRPLPDRVNIVISRHLKINTKGVEVARSLDDAINKAKKHGTNDVFIIGGQQVFDEAINIADKIYLTRIHAKLTGDRFFLYDLSDWQETARSHHPADAAHKYPFDMIELIRK